MINFLNPKLYIILMSLIQRDHHLCNQSLRGKTKMAAVLGKFFSAFLRSLEF